ncbi:MAG: ribosome small subunit-dependent GTPase A [Planctomycetes bacterium]|nr:ribosome small subunit-dependent GTPase A [Planctomycetota bacterium]
MKVRVAAEEWTCELRGSFRRRRETVVVGDRVRVAQRSELAGVIEEILPRRNYLSRRREVGGGRELLVASNLDQVVAVFAARRPRPKLGALDRLLVAAEHRRLPARIVLNKIDLGVDSALDQELRDYESIGYAVSRVSAATGEGLTALESALAGRVSVVSGPSGAGKSSLLSRILGIEIRVGEVSEHNEKGRHTTTAATGYAEPGGGALIDTPGFRDYGLWDLEPADLAGCMPDIFRFAGDCRFANCRHREEPDCAVVAAVDAGDVSARRLRSYRGILDSLG